MRRTSTYEWLHLSDLNERRAGSYSGPLSQRSVAPRCTAVASLRAKGEKPTVGHAVSRAPYLDFSRPFTAILPLHGALPRCWFEFGTIVGGDNCSNDSFCSKDKTLWTRIRRVTRWNGDMNMTLSAR